MTPVVVLFSYKKDVIGFLLLDMGDFWNSYVHGHDGVLFALAATPLGRVPK